MPIAAMSTGYVPATAEFVTTAECAQADMSSPLSEVSQRIVSCSPAQQDGTPIVSIDLRAESPRFANVAVAIANPPSKVSPVGVPATNASVPSLVWKVFSTLS